MSGGEIPDAVEKISKRLLTTFSRMSEDEIAGSSITLIIAGSETSQ
jgi:cytochrome P450